MRESLCEKCDLFIKNRDTVKAALPLESDYLAAVCASLFMNKDILVTGERLKECYKLLKTRVNSFSSFRGMAQLTTVAMLSLVESCEQRLENALEVYSKLKEYFFSSEYLAVSAMLISDSVEPDRWGAVCQKADEIYRLMKKDHPFLTSSEDSVFAVMMALSSRTGEETLSEAEYCYNILIEKFRDRNAVQSLSHMLALVDSDRGSAADKCRDTVYLFDALKESKHKYGTGYELATLGVLASLPCSAEETVRDLIEVSDFLKKQKGYGFFGFSREQRLMHAGMIVTCERLGELDNMVTSAIGGTLSLMAAQQAAVCAAIAVSVAATSATRHC